MKEFTVVLIWFLFYLIVGTIELTPEEDNSDFYYALPECVVITERGNEYVMEVTAYTSCVNETDETPFITATGDSVRIGIVAGDPAIFPFGTKFIVPGYNNNKPCVMLDSGSKIKGYKLDVWFPTKEEARKWGRRIMKVKRVK